MMPASVSRNSAALPRDASRARPIPFPSVIHCKAKRRQSNRGEQKKKKRMIRCVFAHLSVGLGWCWCQYFCGDIRWDVGWEPFCRVESCSRKNQLRFFDKILAALQVTLCENTPENSTVSQVTMPLKATLFFLLQLIVMFALGDRITNSHHVPTSIVADVAGATSPRRSFTRRSRVQRKCALQKPLRVSSLQSR